MKKATLQKQRQELQEQPPSLRLIAGTSSSTSDKIKSLPSEQIRGPNENLTQIRWDEFFSSFFKMVIVPFLIPISIYVATAIFNNRKDLLNKELDRKITTKDIVLTALTNLRRVHERIKLNCKLHPNSAVDETEIKKAITNRFEAEWELILAGSKSKAIFGDNVNSSIHAFLAWDERIVNICAMDALSNEDYRLRQKVISDKMDEIIELDKVKLLHMFW